ncbi:MAG TPA: hypothetical protein VN176_17790 [Verrucomicrobiae bacterium]|jgi:hypothetical protein|nr:hypothetical protein [Verrucomicrobiae bacterium]
MKPFFGKAFFAVAIISAVIPAWTQSCQSGDEIPAAVRTAIEDLAHRTFEQASFGDFEAIRANLSPAVKASFDSIAAAVRDNQPAFAGANRQVRISFLLDTGAAPSPDGRFYCGVFGATGATGSSAEFDIPGLSAGKYAIVIQDLTGSKGPYAFTTIFQDAGGWKLAGFYIRPETAAGHDGLWYLARAREFKTKGQVHNAWFYYWTSWDLMAPVTFMDTKLLSRITQEANAAQPNDVPIAGNAVNYSAQGKTYKITDISAWRLPAGLDLSVRYSVASTADFAATQADARALADALVAQYPEYKDAFNTVWVHAIDPNGGDVPGMVKLKP